MLIVRRLGDPRRAGARLSSTRAVASDAALASIGLLSFAAVAQIAPAFLGGLVWRRGTARGAIGGHVGRARSSGLYLLLLPSLERQGALADSSRNGPLGVAWLRPAALTGFRA